MKQTETVMETNKVKDDNLTKQPITKKIFKFMAAGFLIVLGVILWISILALSSKKWLSIQKDIVDLKAQLDLLETRLKSGISGIDDQVTKVLSLVDKLEDQTSKLKVKTQEIQELVSTSCVEIVNKTETRVGHLETAVVLITKNVNSLAENRSSSPSEDFVWWRSTVESRFSNFQDKSENLLVTLFTQGSNYTIQLHQTNSRLLSLNTQLETTVTKLNDLETRLSRTTNDLTIWKQSAATDIRLSDEEQTAVWRGRGYFDHYGYVITQVSNFNSDAYVDNVSRRRIQKLVNGVWVNI